MRQLLLVVLVCLANLVQATNYYFSSQWGDDSRTTVQAQNPSTPWRSTEKFNAFNLSLKPGDSVFFRRGDVFAGSIVIKSSGTASNPIYYGAYGTGANPLISGFTTLSNWTQLSGGIYFTSLDVPILNMVTINGQAKAMGRFPNAGFMKYEGTNGNQSITSAALNTGTNWTGAEAVIRKYRFILDRHKVTSQSGTTLNYSTSTAYGNNTAYNPVKNNGFFLQNHLGTLDQSGEWYYDPSAKRVYVHFGSSAPSSFVVKASTRDYNAFVTTANFMVFENLDFEGGNTKGFFMTTTSNTHLRNCNFSNQGGVSFDALNVSWITVKGGTVNTSFSNGVFFEHNANNCTVDGVTVRNTNTNPGSGRSGTGISVGITINGNGSRIINNKVYNSGYNGISFLGDNVLVERNLIDTYCTLKDDGGGIYTYIGESNATSYNRKVRNNIIINAVGAYAGAEAYWYESFGKAAGIYLDEHVNNVEVTGNVVGNGDWGGIFLHNAHHNVISNNIFYNHRYQVLVSQYTAMTRANTMTNNQYISKYGYQETFYYRTFVADNPSTMGTFNNNVYARPIDDNRTIHCDFYQSGGAGTQFYTLDQWRQYFSLDAVSKRSPVTFKSNIDDSIRFEYNASEVARVVNLDGSYVDAKGTPYAGAISIEPFTGIVLLRSRTSFKAAQVITFPSIGNKIFGEAPITLNATSSSGLAVSYRLVTGPASLSGNTLTLTGAGTVTVEATQAGDATYNAAEAVSQSFTVTATRQNQTITFPAITNRTFGDAPFTLTATASSGLPVSYRILSGPASVLGNVVTISGIGLIWIEASQAGNANYEPAASQSQSLLVIEPTDVKQAQTINFGWLGNRSFGSAPFDLAATASSGLPVGYRIISGPATLSSKTVTLTGTGNVIIEALQGGNENFDAAVPVQRSFTVTKGSQGITFSAMSSRSIGESFTLNATASSGLPVSYKVVNGPATVSGNTVTTTGIGSVSIEASQSGNANFFAAEAVTQHFSVVNGTKQEQTINFGTLSYKTYTSPDFTINATASSGLPVSFKVITGPVTLVNENTLKVTGVGNVVIEATQPGDADFHSAAPVQRTFTVGKAGQFLTFGTILNRTVGDPPFTLTAKSSSGLPVQYRVVSGPASILGNIVTLLGSGNVTIEATQQGDDFFNAAWPLQRTFTVATSTSTRLSQVITFNSIANQVYGGEPVALTAAATSGLRVSYRVLSGPATVSNNIVTINGVGTVTIEAMQAGNNTYQPASPVSQSFEVTKGTQAISFGEIDDMNVGDEPVELKALSTAGLPVSYRIVSGPATLDGNILTITGAGMVTVEATQPGDSNYEAAQPVRQQFAVASLVKQDQTINFGTLGYKTFTSADFTITATSSSGLPVSFRVISGPVILSGDVVSIYGIGNVTIEAFQPGNSTFKAASPVRRSFTVGKAGQTLTFPTIANKTTGDSPFALEATASSGLPVVYKVVSGPATIEGNMVIVTGAGTVTIEASQPGDDNYTAAFTLQRSFVVVPASNNLLTTTAPVQPLQGSRTSVEEQVLKNTVVVYPNPVTSDATVNVTVAKTTEAALEIVDISGRLVQSFGTRRFESGQVNTVRLHASSFTNGMYFIRLADKEGKVISQRFQVVR
jgi:parallel beta-helix repeat protein